MHRLDQRMMRQDSVLREAIHNGKGGPRRGSVPSLGVSNSKSTYAPLYLPVSATLKKGEQSGSETR